MDAVNMEQYLAKITQLRKQGWDSAEISISLKEQNLPEAKVDQLMEEWKKWRAARKRNQGFICCFVGMAMLVLSFIVSVMLFYAEQNISLSLYGITFAGLCLTFRGMVSIMGW